MPEAVLVTGDQRQAERSLRWKMIVQAGLGDMQCRGDIGVAEGIVASRLHEALGSVQNALGGLVPIVSLNIPHVLHAPRCLLRLLLP